MVFGVRSPVDFREEYFSAVLAAAHDFACLRIDRPVAGKPSYDGRKTGYRLAGLTPSPGGIRTRWTTTSRFRKDAPPMKEIYSKICYLSVKVGDTSFPI
jgi:hypothetical protein